MFYHSVAETAEITDTIKPHYGHDRSEVARIVEDFEKHPFMPVPPTELIVPDVITHHEPLSTTRYVGSIAIGS